MCVAVAVSTLAAAAAARVGVVGCKIQIGFFFSDVCIIFVLYPLRWA